MEIRTELINEEGIISEKYTCDGEDVNPSIALGEIPEFTKSIALIFEDPDAPDPNPFVHWLLWNVSPGDKIKEDSFPEGAVRGENDFGKLNYGGPCPPIG
ncbi:MAG: YbhB/YbcL family Raf kinase inhibitor-like protein, partial [Minisyncoccales bacterium]